jgi:hypothetical protein
MARDPMPPGAAPPDEFPFYAVVSLVLCAIGIITRMISLNLTSRNVMRIARDLPTVDPPAVLQLLVLLSFPCTIVGAVLAFRSFLEEKPHWRLIAVFVGVLAVLMQMMMV